MPLLKHIKNGASNLDSNSDLTSNEDGTMRVTITWDDTKLEWLGGEVSRHGNERFNMFLYYTIDPAHNSNNPSYCSTTAMTGN